MRAKARTLTRSQLIAGVLCASGQALAHAHLKTDGSLPPRSADDGLKTAPCGGIAVNETKRTQLTAGATITVEWLETVNHPGYYRLLLFPDTTAAGLPTGTPTVLIDNHADDQNSGALPHRFSKPITVPAISCEKCVVQFIQVMTDRNPPSNYYSCADVRIGTGTSTGTATATTTETGTETATVTSTGTATGTGTTSASKLQAPGNVQVKKWEDSP